MFTLIMSLELDFLRSVSVDCHNWLQKILKIDLSLFAFTQTKVPGVKSVISKASGSKADMFVESGDKVSIGDLYLEV